MSDRIVIRFGAFEVSPQSGELRKHGLRIKLQDQPFKLLVALLEKPGEVVSRDELRERIWGTDTCVDFDHGLSAAVNRLREALGDSAEHPRYVETMARRGYRFIAAVEGLPAAPTVAGGRSDPKLVWAAVALLVALTTGVGLWLARNGSDLPAPRLVRLTALTGMETMPTFSPDGRQVAFVWNGGEQDNNDIYVKMLGSATLLRLTSHPADDTHPAWSPDGSQIALLSRRGQTGIYLVSPLGGPERKLLDLTGANQPFWSADRPSWSADGKFLAVTRPSGEPPGPGDGAVLLVPVEGGGQPREMLVPAPGTYYKHPAFSPDGRRLAVASCSEGCQLQIVSLNRDLLPEGTPRTVVSQRSPVWGLAWLPDGTFLVVSGFWLDGDSLAVSGFSGLDLSRVSVVGKSEPIRIEVGGEEAFWPAIAPQGDRIAFARSVGLPRQADIWRWQRGGTSSTFLSSSLTDHSPQFSADGRRIAFHSSRGGGPAVWVANADGTGLVEITKGFGQYTGTPRWSPDGQWIAFDSYANRGGWEVWKVQAGGGPPRQLTHGPASNAIPSWARDGKRVYFWSNRSGADEIWCVPADGGAAQQITHRGGHTGFESADGKTLYYTKSRSGAEGLYGLALAGGEEKQVVTDQVMYWSFAVVADGIYYITPRGKSLFEIRFHEFGRGRSRSIREIEGPLRPGFSVSPDQNTFLFSRASPEADLMLIENFR